MTTPTFTQVAIDLSKDDSMSQTYDPSSNRITTKYTHTWVVVGSDKTWFAVDLRGASDGTNNLPIVSQPYDIGLGGFPAVCDGVHISRTGPLSWSAAVSYYQITLPDSTIKLSLSSVAYPQQAYFDKDGNAVVNSATQPFDPTLTKTYFDAKFTLSYQSFIMPPIDTIMGAKGKVNSDSVSISVGGWSKTFTARQLKEDDSSADFEYHGTDRIWSVSVSFIVRIDTYVDKLLDQGYCRINDAGNLEGIVDDNGDPVNSPVMLDGSGDVLAMGADPVYLSFPIETETAMSAIISAII